MNLATTSNPPGLLLKDAANSAAPVAHLPVPSLSSPNAGCPKYDAKSKVKAKITFHSPDPNRGLCTGQKVPFMFKPTVCFS